MARMSINWQLLPIKCYYFCYFGGYSSFWPYLAHYLTQRGWTPVDYTLIMGTVPFLFMFTRPLFSHFADKHSRHKAAILICLSLGLICNSLIWFVPSPADSIIKFANSIDRLGQNVHKVVRHNNSTHFEEELHNLSLLEDVALLDQRWSHFDQVYYWMVLSLTVLGTSLGLNPTADIVDSICLCILNKKKRHLFGRERLWMTVGCGIAMLFTAYLMDAVSADSKRFVNYAPAFASYLALIAAAFVSACLIAMPPEMMLNRNRSDPQMLVRHNGMRMVFGLTKEVKVSLFLVSNLLAGLNGGMSLFIGVVFIKQLGAQQIVIGVSGCIMCVFTAVGFLLSGRIIKKVGHQWTLILVLALYSIRAAIFSLIVEPWLSLIMNAIFGLSMALNLASTGSFAAKHASKGSQSSTQAFFMAVGEGVGVALGNVIGGAIFQKCGARVTWRIFSISTAIFVFVVSIYLKQNKPPETSATTTNDIDYNDDNCNATACSPEMEAGVGK